MLVTYRRFAPACFTPVGLAAAVLLWGAALATTAASAQETPPSGFEPTTFAIAEGIVIPRPGELIQPGVVVIRNGSIVAVGSSAEVTIPPDARVISAKGLYVYAGFIDAGNSTWLDDEKKPKPQPGRRVDFSRYVLAATAEDNRNHLTPTFLAHEGLKNDPNLIAAWRQAGFTAVHVLPRGRIASGQGALLSARPAPLRETLLSERTLAQFRLFAAEGKVYPATLMGCTAHLRQAFLDARRQTLHEELYRQRTPGVPRPPADADLDAFAELLARRQSPVFEVSSRDDIFRAIEFCEEINVRPALWGNRDLHRAHQTIVKYQLPCFVPLDFGSSPKIEPRKAETRLVAEIKDPLRVQQDRLRQWEERLRGIQELQTAGIPVAFCSEGLKKPEEAFAAIRLLREQGMTADQALASLTTVPAALLGQKDRLGVIQPDALAHLIVMTGPFDHKESKVRHLFVDGLHEEFNPTAQPVPTTPEERQPLIAQRPELPSQEEPTELETDRTTRPLVSGGNVLIRNATVLTATGKTLLNTSILIREGKIAEIGPDLPAPDGLLTIDATGMFVMPGIIDTHSHIMAAGGLNESTMSVVPEVRVKDVINTGDVSAWRALAGGVTMVRILHGSANTVGGQDAVVKLKYGAPAREQIQRWAPQGVKFALGENVKRNPDRFPNTRLGVEATLNRAFLEALDYRNRWREYEKSSRSGGAAKRLPPRRDLRLEALAKMIDHEIFIHSHCYRADEILMLLRVAEGLGIRVWSLQHVLEGYKVAPEILAHGASCSTFADWWAYKVEAFDAIPYNAALLNEAGINTVIKSDDWELVRHLYYEAAKPIRYGGVSPEDALRFITLNPAKELGLDERVGSVEIGKDADLGIYNGHPFNSFSRCEYTLIEGEIYYCRAQAPTVQSQSRTMRNRSAHPAPVRLPSVESRQRTLELPVNPAGRYAIVGATLHPVDGPAIPNGTLLIENGKIAALGEIAVPDGTQIIAAQGLHVYPGLIDAGTTLGLTEIGSVGEASDFAESGNYQPDLRAGVALNPDSELIPVARAGGILSILMRPTGGLVAGQNSLANLAGWTAPEMVFELEHAMQINWPNNDSEKVARQLGEFLKTARAYVEIKENAKRQKTLPPIADPRFEALEPYLAGKKPVHIEANSRRQIAEALLFAEKEKLKIVITGGTQAWKLADELKKRNVPVIVGPVMQKPLSDYDPQDAPYGNAGLLYEAGVKFCIRSNSASNSRNAPFEAAMAVAHGLPEEEALRAVTLSAAEILGVEDQLGSLTVGKQANLIITSGSPLQITSQIKGVFVNGAPYAPVSRQTRFYERYRERLLRSAQ